MARSPRIPAGYTAADLDRFFQEPPKSQNRTPFQRDRARVLHSSALRRLGAKTQVLGAGENDFVRTRLTHSLEVAQVGRDIAEELGCDPNLVDLACLAHDLGHPPFGHNGERVLNTLADPVGGFEGNAQSLRLLARLEPKVLDADRSYGLNLTRAALDASIKYPWRRGEGPNPSSPKFGVYEDDLPVFDFVRDGAPAQQQCLEAQVMDISDDIAYSVHDIEDAVTGFRMNPALLHDPMERSAALYVVQDWYTPTRSIDELDTALTRLEADPAWLHEYTGNLADSAALKDLSSQLIGRFVSAVVTATQAEYGTDPIARYQGQVVVPEETALEISVLKGLAAAYVMSSREQQPVYEQQEQIITDLHAALRSTGRTHLNPLFRSLWDRAADGDERERVIIDQIASFTDVMAVRLHAELFGSGSSASALDEPLPGLGPDLPTA
ncbi:deoxyguanosinetriphosphate triphosphohydrolase [Helcobacillus sp. ACRRO]|uniref:deoxyguanosinetriphosphate triphosphohydrolase n=1 Tax=Helcobacillus sp. ACRRO TaxID=2918202 RepID=UPI001EF517BD|nr:deoxyguanosinetriphosphate triphosphohydrolase [Helcobacillus sp. ACRRO]